MDRLFESAQTGNIEELHNVLAEFPLILHQLPLMCTENPLHFAGTAGHLEYVKEILHLKPKFAEKLNMEGHSPMHLASANGHVEIVREMIKVDPMICRLEGKDGMTPLHHAALRGRVDVIREMLAICERSMEDVTVRGETALHLAVKNYQLGSFRVMLDWIRQVNKEHILNKKDEHGNTVLHLAVWKKQRQVLDALLGSGLGALEINATNSSGLTALDLLLMFPSEAGDREIQEILQGAGAVKAQALALPVSNQSFSTQDCPVSNSSTDPIQYFTFLKGRDSPSEARGTLLVIAVLVATATYQLGISPPGDVWQDNDEGHIAGSSILGTNNVILYTLLISFNSIGLCLSLYMIDKLTSKFPLQIELQACLLSIYFTYNLSVPAISPPEAKRFINIFTTILPVAVPVICKLLRKYRVFERAVRIFRRCS